MAARNVATVETGVSPADSIGTTPRDIKYCDVGIASLEDFLVLGQQVQVLHPVWCPLDPSSPA